MWLEVFLCQVQAFFLFESARFHANKEAVIYIISPLTKTFMMILNWKNPLVAMFFTNYFSALIKPEFTIVIFIHYKPRIAVAILDL